MSPLRFFWLELLLAIKLPLPLLLAFILVPLSGDGSVDQLIEVWMRRRIHKAPDGGVETMEECSCFFSSVSAAGGS